MTRWNDDFDKRWARHEKMGDSIFGIVRRMFILVFAVIILSILAQIALAFGLLHVVTTTDPTEAASSLGEIVRAFEESRKGE